MEIKVMTPIVHNLMWTDWRTYDDSTKEFLIRDITSRIVPVMKEANSKLLLETGHESVEHLNSKSPYGFKIMFVINKDAPSYFIIHADAMFVLRAVEEIMREIVISGDDDNKTTEPMMLCEQRAVEQVLMRYALPLGSVVIANYDKKDLLKFKGERVAIINRIDEFGNHNIRYAKLITTSELRMPMPEPELGCVYISEDLHRGGIESGDSVWITSESFLTNIGGQTAPFKLTPPEVELIDEMKNDDKKTIKCVNRRLETAIEELPYSTMLISPDDTQLFHTVGKTALVKGPNGTMMSVAVGTSGNKEVIPDDGYIHLSTDVTNSLNIDNETELQVFYNLDSDNIKKEFPELFECDTTPFTHHYKMRRKVSFIRDGKAIDNKNVIFVDKYDPIVTTEGVAQPIHVNKLNEIPTVSCYFIQSDDRYMMSGCIGVSKYMADMMPLKNGQIVEIDIIVHSDNPIKKHSLDFEKLNPGEYESTSSKGLHIEPEIRNDKFTAFSICKDQSDKQEEKTTDETD